MFWSLIPSFFLAFHDRSIARSSAEHRCEALSGLISAVIGALLYASLPWSGLWVLGTLIGIELVVQGVT